MFSRFKNIDVVRQAAEASQILDSALELNHVSEKTIFTPDEIARLRRIVGRNSFRPLSDPSDRAEFLTRMNDKFPKQPSRRGAHLPEVDPEVDPEADPEIYRLYAGNRRTRRAKSSYRGSRRAKSSYRGSRRSKV
jgi:hypothetical protein